MSMKKRLADIVTRFRVDGARQAGQEMQSVSAAAAKASKATDSLSGTGAAQIAGAAGAAAGQLDEVRESALAAKRAIAEIGNVRVNGRGLDLGLNASGKDAAASAAAFQSAYVDTQRRVAATSLAGIDTSKIAPNVDRGVLERALKAARQAAGDGVPIDVYVDPTSLVRVEKNVLKALDDLTPTIDFSNVDKGALKRAGEAMSKALASGMKLDSFIDAQTKTAFSAEQLQELARTGYGAGEALEDVADKAKVADRVVRKIDGKPIEKVTDESRSATRGFRQLTTGAQVLVRGLGAVTRAGTAMGTTLVAAARRSSGALKALTAGISGVAAGQGLSAGAAGGFAVRAGNESVERLQQTRSASALTGMSPDLVQFWERYGAKAGLQDTDLNQVFSGFVAAIRDAEDPASNVAKIFKQLGVATKDAKGQAREFSLIFSDFLAKSQRLNTQARGGAFTQVFGEDDALKVAELAKFVARDFGKLNEMRAKDQAEGRLVSEKDVAQVRRYQTATLRLADTWDTFKRKVFLAAEPILTRYARFFEGEIFKRGGGIITTMFVRPIEAADRTFQRFWKFFQDTNELETFRKRMVTTWRVVQQLGRTLLEVGKAFLTAFPVSSAAVGDAYLSFLIAVNWQLIKLGDWFRSKGAQAFRWTGRFLSDLWQLAVVGAAVFAGLARGIDDALVARGIDWRAVLRPDAITAAMQEVVRYFGALFRDIGRLMSGGDARLETGLAKWLVQAFEYAREKVGDVVVGIRKGFEKAITGVQARVASFVAYLKTSFAEFQQAMSGGLAIEDISTRLGQLMAILGSVVDYLVRLGQAIREVVVEGKKAPAGFAWLETVYGIAERLGGAIKNIFEALKAFTTPFDAILKKMGLWDTATIALAGLIVSKIAAAFGVTVVGAILKAIDAAKKLVAILGFGAAGSAAAGAATAASGAAAAGATGGILAGVTAIGAALGQVLLRFTPIVGALAGITAGFYAILTQADRLMPFIDKLGGALGLKTKADVETDVAAIRAQMNADYARYGGKTGVSPVAAAAPSDGVIRQLEFLPTTAEMNQIAAKYAPTFERPTNVVNLSIEGLARPVTLSGTDSQVAELQRMRARRLG